MCYEVSLQEHFIELERIFPCDIRLRQGKIHFEENLNNLSKIHRNGSKLVGQSLET